MIRRSLAFWLASVVVAAAVAAWYTWVVGSLEPDFGDAFGNFGTTVLLFAVIALMPAVCHAITAILLRSISPHVSGTYEVTTSVLSGAAYQIVLSLSPAAEVELPSGPILVPCALAVIVSLVVLAVAARIFTKRRPRAA